MPDKVVSLATDEKPKRILRWPQVHERTHISRTRWEVGMQRGIYPRPFKLAPAPSRAVGWLESDIDALIERLATAEEA